MVSIFEEKHSAKGIVRAIGKLEEGPGWLKVVRWNQHRDEINFSPWFSVNQMFKEIFLPRGYPDSVCSDYLAYQIWDSLQAFGSSITGTLATHNVFKGMGVGDQSATVLSATFTWLLKDGTGMVGRIIFTYFKGSNLDVDCKKWRLFADILNDFATGLDMICPIFPGYLLFLQCSSGFLKSLVGTIGGATRAALTQHQARNNNLADVSAKDASQETLVNLAALITSLILVPFIAESEPLVWITFVLLTIIHIYCNYRAVKSVNMEVFNPARWSSFIEKYIFNLTISSIEEVNQLENVWFFSTQFQDQIQSGVPLSDHNLTDEQYDYLINNFHNMGYVLSVNDKDNVLISFFDGQDSVRNKMKAYFHGNLILFALTDPNKAKALRITGNNDQNKSTISLIVKLTRSIVEEKFDQMVTNAMDKGWNLSNFIFLENGWRVKSRIPYSDKKSS